MIAALHPWTSFLILPLFAWANAGVRLEPGLFRSLTGPAGIGIAFGLVIGKPLGRSIFISGLVFGEGRELDAAKLAVFPASALSGIAGYAFLRALPAIRTEAHRA
jgi:Na+/H+ antiporter NhaA